MHNIGLGHNLHFLKKSAALTFPENVSIVEMGLQDFQRFEENPYTDFSKLALHIARTPITESLEYQKEYISNLKKDFGGRELSAFGFHLMGERSEGIGAYGFTSHYLANETAQSRAIDFIKLAQDEFNCPIWVENANFYSSNMSEIIRTWESLNEILDQTDCGLILDATHLLIDTYNIGIEPEYLFGLIPFGKIKEVHVSGLVEGRDGAFHDGHSMAVHDRVWNILDKILVLVGQFDYEEIVFTLEHTDPSWGTKTELFYSDMEKLRNVIATPQVALGNRKDAASAYAKGNLFRILKMRMPQLNDLLEKSGTNFKEMFALWIADLEKSGDRIVLSQVEKDLSASSPSQVAKDSLLEYVKRYAAK